MQYKIILDSTAVCVSIKYGSNMHNCTKKLLWPLQYFKIRSVSEFLFVGINHGKNLTQALLNEKKCELRTISDKFIRFLTYGLRFNSLCWKPQQVNILTH